MIQVKRAIVHILDLHSGVPIYSDTDLDRELFEYIQKHLEKAAKDAAAHPSKLGDVNPVRQKLEQFMTDAEQFAAITQEMAGKLHQDLMLAGEERAMDFVAVEFLHAEIPHFGILLYPNQVGYTHKISYQDNVASNQIIQHFAILPNPTQKLTMFAFVNLEDWSVKFVDKKRVLDGEEVFLLPDRLLNCTMPVSSKDTIKKVHKIVTKVAEEFGENPTRAVCQAKAVLLEAGEKAERIEPETVGRKVFAHHSGMQAAYMEQITHASLPKVAEVDRDYAVRTNKSHKIKTDTGIELIVPSDFFNNTDYIEFVTNDNGTISINIKNVGEIINR